MRVNAKSFKLLIPELWNKIARMPRELNKFLILFFGFLQTLAPLAHAHTGNYAAYPGLHIPGLEAFHHIHDAPVLTNVNNEGEREGLLVMVETGIKSPLPGIVKIPENPFNCVIISQVQFNFLPENDQNFSPHQSRTYPLAHLFPPHSPRAPPV